MTGLNSGIWSILTSSLFWIAVVIIAVIFLYCVLRMRIKRKLKFPVIILTDLGKGKIGYQTTVGGWFKNKWILNIYNYGTEDEFICKDKSKIFKVDTKAYHDINGSRGLVCYRKSDDPRILIPVSRMVVDNDELLMEIAPADYREVSIDIVKKDTAETLSTLDKYLPYIAFGFLGIILMVCIIIIVQYNKHALSEARTMVENGCKNYPITSGAKPSTGAL